MLTKAKKIELVAELSEILKNSPNILFVDFAGLKMDEISSLKKDLKKEGIGFKALKKSLLGFAFGKSGKGPFDLSSHKGSVAITYGQEESGAIAAKIINNFSVRSNKLAILGGFLMGEKMMKDKVVMLAQLPSREVLTAQFLHLLMSPISGFARVVDAMAKKVI